MTAGTAPSARQTKTKVTAKPMRNMTKSKHAEPNILWTANPFVRYTPRQGRGPPQLHMIGDDARRNVDLADEAAIGIASIFSKLTQHFEHEEAPLKSRDALLGMFGGTALGSLHRFDNNLPGTRLRVYVLCLAQANRYRRGPPAPPSDDTPARVVRWIIF